MGAGPADECILVELSLAEAMTVAAAVRQYEPYWSPQLTDAGVVQELTATTAHVMSILGKLRTAAAKY